MPARWKRSAYLKVRRWVDHDLVTYPRHSLSLEGSSVLIIVLGLAAYALGSIALIAFWLVMFPVWAAWAAFVLWRVARLVRAASIRGDRQYDQKGKFRLPPEYASTESATAASRRRRRKASQPSTTV